MARILIRLFAVLALMFTAFIQILSVVTGVDIWKKYGKHITIGISLFIGLVLAMYITLALLGVG